MTRKNEMTPAHLTENIFDIIADTGFAHLAAADMAEYLEDKNMELNWDAGVIYILEGDTDQENYKITITKTEV